MTSLAGALPQLFCDRCATKCDQRPATSEEIGWTPIHLRLRVKRGKTSRALLRRIQVGQQVGHSGDVQLFLQAFGHERQTGADDLFNVDS